MDSHTPSRWRNIVGPQVRKLRDQRGWSQATLAARCQVAGWDITRDVVATIEGRTRWIGDFELVILARVLEVEITALLPARIKWRELNLVLQ